MDKRANEELAHILSDYAHERWAAHRTVNPLLWRCVAPFVDDKILPDIERIATSADKPEQIAAALVCRECHYPPVNALMDKFPSIKALAEDPALSWDTLVQGTSFVE